MCATVEVGDRPVGGVVQLGGGVVSMSISTSMAVRVRGGGSHVASSTHEAIEGLDDCWCGS